MKIAVTRISLMLTAQSRGIIKEKGQEILFLFLPLAWCLLPTLAQAESITPAADGTGTTVTPNGNEFQIDGGQRAGTNLFHSFERFGLNSGEIANFIARPGVENIFSRVTGGNASVIDGLLKISRGDANLFFMNPAGIIFGSNVSLDTRGSFTATTANGIGFESGWFNAIGNNNYAELVGNPNTFAFTMSQPAPIVNAGNLQVAKDQNLTLLGGTVVNTGQLSAPNGQITVAAVPGSTLVRLTQQGQLLSLEIQPSSSSSSQPNTWSLPVLTLPELLTGGGAGNATGLSVSDDGSTVTLSGSGVVISKGDAVAVNQQGTQASLSAQAIRVSAQNAITAGNISAQGVELSAQTGITTGDVTGNQTGKGDAGVVKMTTQQGNINTGRLQLSENSQGNGASVELRATQGSITTGAIITTEKGPGSAGFVTLEAAGNITVNGNIDSSDQSQGDGGDIKLSSTQGSITVNGDIDTSEKGQGVAGSVDLSAQGTIRTGNINSAGDNSSSGSNGNEIRILTRGAKSDIVTGSLSGDTIDVTTQRFFRSSGSVSTPGGAITIRHGGGDQDPPVSFIVGDNSKNGTAGEIRSGSASIQPTRTIPFGTYQESNSNIKITSPASSMPAPPISGAGQSAPNPGQNNQNSGQGNPNPGTGNNNPDPNDDQPGQGNQNSGQGNQNSGQGNQNSGQGNQNSGQGNQNSGQGNQNSGQGNQNSGQGNQNSGQGNQNSGQGNQNSGQGNQNSGQGNQNSGQGNQNSGQGNQNSGQGNQNSGQGNSSSGRGNQNSAQGNQNSGQGNSGSQPSRSNSGQDSGSTSSGQDNGDSSPSGQEPIVSTSEQKRPISQALRHGNSASQTPVARSMSVLSAETDPVQTLDEPFTNQFQQHLGLPNDTPVTTLAQASSILLNIEQTTGVKPALIYVTFVPQSVENSAATAQTKSLSKSNQVSAGRDNEQLELLIVTSSGEPIRQRILGTNRAEVLKVAGQFRSQILKKSNNGYLSSGKQLYEWLIKPIERDLRAKDVKNLVFIMDSGLRSIPLAAIHDGQQFLVEQYSVGLMPSLSLTDTRHQDIKNLEVLAMGAAKFNDVQQKPLPAVPVELASITPKMWKGKSFLNENFTLKNLKAARAKEFFGIIHLATHAEFQMGNASNSYIQLWDTKLRLDQLRELGWSNPPVELLVLSACRTAMGNEEAELGFAGFAVQAGVKSALASLWYVSDQGTLGLMREFYEQLKEAPIKAEALRQAQIAMIKGQVKVTGEYLHTSTGDVSFPPEMAKQGETNLSHPFYWAAFTIVGNPW